MLSPKTLLRIEGAVLLGICLYAYIVLHDSWWLFALLLLVPDLSMLGYLINPRFGAACYNLAHTTLAPALLGLIAFATHHALELALCAIWLAHIGMDRMLGYGLKYPTAFRDTHLQRV